MYFFPLISFLGWKKRRKAAAIYKVKAPASLLEEEVVGEITVGDE